MLDIRIIREQPELIKAGLLKKNFPKAELGIVDQIISADTERRQLQTERDALLAENNKASKEIGQLYRDGRQAEADLLKATVSTQKDTINEIEASEEIAAQNLEDLLIQLPNMPHESVPVGTSPEDNEVAQAWDGPMPDLPQGAKPHWDLVKDYNLIDFELGSRITGSGFPLYRGKGAKLQRALISFFLDESTAAGYEEILPPYLVNEASAIATGQLPDKEGQMYFIEKDNLYLIPTAEVPVTNILRDVILDQENMPVKMTAYTPSFRREAGAHGSQVRGLNRVHQFDKVEIVQATHPDHSYAALEEMVEHVRGLMAKLELPYRILRLCGGDMSFASALTYDFEVWAAAQERWLEVSSVSNFETFQSNRMRLRFRNDAGKTELAHTLNGSALALARIVAAIIENNQTSEGIKLPAVLVPYMGMEYIN